MKNLVAITGAGISAESGLKTFRDSDGLWEGHAVEDVATPGAWHRNPQLVLEFYNQRRRALALAAPHAGHRALAELETAFHVNIITQNVDDLHERAGSSNVLHLHGKLTESRSTRDPDLIYEIKGTELLEGEVCELGSQLRPNIVWFGEAVPMMEPAIEIVKRADVAVIAGTSLVVYPAASLLDYLPVHAKVFVVDPVIPDRVLGDSSIECFTMPASSGMPKLRDRLLGH
ncbi:MAG: NAD-dependent protein deacylase [Bdellovibrionales bacterium]|nr:NAD-dependent protein deacylase [Bdellovibrionales bacterium]